MPDGRIISANPAACAMFGMSEAELCRVGRQGISDPDDAKLRALIEERDRKGRVTKAELYFTRKNGERFPVEVDSVILPGDPTRSFVIMRDITERKREAETQNILKKSIDVASDAAYWMDSDVRFIYVNEAACNSLGYDRDQLMSLHVYDVNPRVDAERWSQAFAQIQAAGTLQIESVHRRKDGTEFPVEIASTFVKFDKGNYICGFARDITERKHSADALREQRNVMSSIFESVPSILMLVDSDVHVQDINRIGVEFAGHEKAGLLKLLGGEVFGCVNSLSGAGCGRNEDCSHCPIRSRVTHTFRTGEPAYNEEGRLTVRRGDMDLAIEFLISVIPIKVRDAEQVLVVITDITPLKRAEKDRENLQAQLTQAQRLEAVGHLAGGVAHDFNNILAAMMMRLSLLQRDRALSPETADALVDFESDVKRAVDLTRQLLLFGRRQVMQVKVLDLNELVGNLLKMLSRLVEERIKIVFERYSAPLWIEADTGMIEQVATNLCLNARDAMPMGGDLVLRVQNIDIKESHVNAHPEARPGKFACLEVSDQGCGMDEATLERIFEPFFTTKEIGKGSGLGLSTVYGIVKQHNGWLEVESVLGQGSIFRVYLPCSPKTMDSPKALHVPPIHGGNETILFVEDESNLRHMVARLLRSHGYKVIECANGVDAMREWERNRDSIHLLFTDMVMPGKMTGLELGERIRSQRPGLKILIYSGYSIDFPIRVGTSAPGVTYLPKPCEPARLMSVIREVLDGDG
jgi:two-component system, cell cycle sensor histidine kinase and response regulator CckA